MTCGWTGSFLITGRIRLHLDWLELQTWLSGRSICCVRTAPCGSEPVAMSSSSSALFLTLQDLAAVQAVSWRYWHATGHLVCTTARSGGSVLVWDERESGYAEFTPSGEGIDELERPLDDPPSLGSGRCPPTYGGRARRVFAGA